MRIQRNAKLAFAGLAALGTAYYIEPAARAGSTPDFTTDSQPIFDQSSDRCHGAKAQMGGLRLDSKETALAKVIVPGHSADSMLFRRITEPQDQLRMPLGGKPLPPEQIATIKAWIDSGARWPDSAGLDASAIKPHWAWTPPRRPTPPSLKNASWPHN